MIQERWLVITDIDGTILGPAGVSDCTRQSLHSLVRSGHVLAIASGRHIESVVAVLRDLDLSCPFVASNGAFVGLAEDQIVARNNFSTEALNLVTPAVMALDMDLYITLEQDLVRVQRDNRCELQLGTIPVRNGPSVPEPPPVYKYTLCGECSDFPRVVHTLQSDLESVAHVVISDRDTIDVTPLGVNKGTGLKTLCAVLGIPLNRTIAFGNQGNDVDLLRTAQIGVAVGDATDSAKLAANEVAANCADDGVARFINQFFEFY